MPGRLCVIAQLFRVSGGEGRWLSDISRVHCYSVGSTIRRNHQLYQSMVSDLVGSYDCTTRPNLGDSSGALKLVCTLSEHRLYAAWRLRRGVNWQVGGALRHPRRQ